MRTNGQHLRIAVAFDQDGFDLDAVATELRDDDFKAVSYQIDSARPSRYRNALQAPKFSAIRFRSYSNQP